MSKSQNSQEKWTKVGECLYRYKTSGGYYARIKVKGKEFRRSLRTTDLALAKRRLRELRNDFERIEPSSGKVSLEELVKRFRATRGHLDASTQQRDDAIEKSMRRDWPSGFGQKVADVKPSDVEEWLAIQRQRLSKAYSNEFVWFIRRLFEFAIADRILVTSPAAKVNPLRRDTPLRETPSWEQFKRMVEDIRAQKLNADAEDSADFVEFLGLSGLGNSEAANLKWPDVDFQGNRIRVYRNKTDTGFTIPIYPQLRPLLEQLRQKNGRSEDQRVLKVASVRKALDGCCKRLGFPHFTQRSLRRCFITRAVELGIDFKTIAQMQGHRDGGVLVAKTYSHLRNEHLENMAMRLA